MEKDLKKKNFGYTKRKRNKYIYLILVYLSVVIFQFENLSINYLTAEPLFK